MVMHCVETSSSVAVILNLLSAEVAITLVNLVLLSDSEVTIKEVIKAGLVNNFLGFGALL